MAAAPIQAVALTPDEQVVVALVLTGLLLVPLLIVRPAVCLVLAVVVEAGNLAAVAAGQGVPGVHVGVLGVAAAALLRAAVRGELHMVRSPVLLFGLVLVGCQALAALTARDLSTAAVAVLDTVRHGAWLGVVLALLLLSRDAPGWAARAFVVTLSGLALLSGMQEFILNNSTTFLGLSNVPLSADVGSLAARHAGPQSDVNFWGRVLVLGLPFALAAAQVSLSWLHRLGWLLMALAIAAGVVLTGSRGALLALLAAAVVWAVLTHGIRTSALVLSPLLIAAVLLVPGVGTRLASLSLLAPSDVGATDASLQGRLFAQAAALSVVRDHPLLGVGPGNFLEIVPEYFRQLGIDSIPLAPHNLYLEIAAESGLVGLTAWVLFLGSAVFAALRARITLRSAGVSAVRGDLLPLANATLAALAGWAVASLFLHLATARTLLLVVAVAAALDVHARSAAATTHVPRTPAGRQSGVLVQDAPGRAVRGTTAVALLVVAALGVSAWAVLVPPPVRWAASASAELTVTRSASHADLAYEFQALSRENLIRTYAGVLADRRFEQEAASELGLDLDDGRWEVRVASVHPSRLILVRAVAPEPRQAQLLAERVRSAGVDYVNSLGPLFGLDAVQGEPALRRVDVEVLRRRLQLVAGMNVAVGLLGCWWLQRTRRPGSSSSDDGLRVVSGRGGRP